RAPSWIFGAVQGVFPPVDRRANRARGPSAATVSNRKELGLGAHWQWTPVGTLGTVQKSGGGGSDRPLRRCGLQPRLVAQREFASCCDLPIRLSNLLRLLGLFGHGNRRGARPRLRAHEKLRYAVLFHQYP